MSPRTRLGAGGIPPELQPRAGIWDGFAKRWIASSLRSSVPDRRSPIPDPGSRIPDPGSRFPIPDLRSPTSLGVYKIEARWTCTSNDEADYTFHVSVRRSRLFSTELPRISRGGVSELPVLACEVALHEICSKWDCWQFSQSRHLPVPNASFKLCFYSYLSILTLTVQQTAIRCHSPY